MPTSTSKSPPSEIQCAAVSMPSPTRSAHDDGFLLAAMNGSLDLRRSASPRPSFAVMEADSVPVFLGVADGVGLRGELRQIPEIALHATADGLYEGWGKGRTRAPSGLDLRQAVETAERRVRDHKELHNVSIAEARQAGTTLCVAVVDGNFALVANAGHSRCYLYRDGKVKRITKDDTLRELLESGGTGIGTVPHETTSRVVLNFLGGERPVRLAYHPLEWRHGDMLLFCTNGLSDVLGEREIEEEIDPSLPVHEMAQRLAMRGTSVSFDDVTVAVARRS